MGLEDVPFYKRMLDQLARPQPDLSYKFKSASEAASSTMAGSPAASEAPFTPAPEVDISYTDTDILPGRPTHPFEVRVMVDGDGVPTTIRCYKGLICDAGNRNFASFLQGSITQPLISKKRVNLSGNRGNVSGDQKDYTPSNYDASGPEQQKYTEFNDPIQTSFIPSYEGLATGGTMNSGRDPDPEITSVAFATGTYPIGKDSFTSATSGAYYEWPYSNGLMSMVRLFCYDDGDPANRKWGIWGGGGSPPGLGSSGFFILVAQVTGTVVTQFLKSDIVAIGGGGGSHPFKVTCSNGSISVTPGSVNNHIATFATGSYGGGTWHVFVEHTHLGGASIMVATATPSDSDTKSYLTLAIVSGDMVNQLVQSSQWVDRFKCSTQGDANWFWSRV